MPPLRWGEPIKGAVLAAGDRPHQPLLDTSFEDWKRLHAVNADGVFLCLREIARVMIGQAQATPENTRSLVTVASNAARVPALNRCLRGFESSAVRVSSSFGLQLARHGIRVNTVCPGTTRTPMVTDAWVVRTSAPCRWRAAPRPSAWEFRSGASPTPPILRR